MTKPKRIAILGSTGSIGVSALKVISEMPARFEVAALSAHGNVDLLARQARTFKPKLVSLFDSRAAASLKVSLNGAVSHMPSGVEGLIAIASHPDVDVVLTSLVGGVGFAPLLAAIKAGKTIALANKEPMVMAGKQFMREAKRWESKIIPVDSEPSAIFQCLDATATDQRNQQKIRSVILTASGGAFYKRKGSLSDVTVAEALRHPTWQMGRKITIDCATLMNKGFETIEIMNLFDLRLDQVRVVIHPQSIVHSAVEFSDGSVLAQMSEPDMKLPIQYALGYPERGPRLVAPLDLCKAGSLTFFQPDFRRFPCLELAGEAARRGGGWPAVLNAADEVAVEAFLDGRLKFTAIASVIERTLSAYKGTGDLPGFAEVVEIDQWARRKAVEIAARRTNT